MSSQAPPRLVAAVGEYLRRYHRHEVQVDAELPRTPALIVANHGFGGVVDLNALAVVRTLAELESSRPVTFLVHQIAWTVGAGSLIEALGGRPGCKQVVDEAFVAGNHVAVFPGGDFDAAKATKDRNLVRFAGRSGFARVAIEHDVPVVPVVTALLPPMRPETGESAADFAARIEAAMQARLDQLTADRTPILG